MMKNVTLNLQNADLMLNHQNTAKKNKTSKNGEQLKKNKDKEQILKISINKYY